MSDLLDTGSAAPAGPQKPPTLTPPTPPAPPPAATPEAGAETEEKAEKKPTDYIVLVGSEETGPWAQIVNPDTPDGTYQGFGQMQAKKLAAAALNAQGNNAASYYYVAIPQSSFAPEKPKTVEVETRIAF